MCRRYPACRPAPGTWIEIAGAVTVEAFRTEQSNAVDTARRIIVALDFDALRDAEAVVDRLGDAGRSYKVGLELLTTAGPSLAARLAAAGKDVFLDLKLSRSQPRSQVPSVRDAPPIFRAADLIPDLCHLLPLFDPSDALIWGFAVSAGLMCALSR